MTAPLVQLADWLDRAEAVVVGAGAGLSTSAGSLHLRADIGATLAALCAP